MPEIRPPDGVLAQCLYALFARIVQFRAKCSRHMIHAIVILALGVKSRSWLLDESLDHFSARQGFCLAESDFPDGR